jgi:PmbA protein
MEIKQLLSLVKNLPGISAWEIRNLRKKSYQRYLIFDQIESQRVVETEKFAAALYREYNLQGKKCLGETIVSLSEGDNIKEKLALGMEMAALVANPLFSLPEKGLTYDQVQMIDSEVRGRPYAYLDRMQEDLEKIRLKKIKRSSTELYIEDKVFFLINSNGLEQVEEATDLLVEFVLMAEKGPSLEGESQGMKQARFYKDLRLKEMEGKYARYTRESLNARLPKGGRFPVVFSEEALDTLFNYFCLQSSGPACFQNWSQLEISQPVISNLTGEALSLYSNPSLPGGIKTRAFDDNGLPLHRIQVINQNIFQKRMNTKRYADYLQEEATGDFSNREVGRGPKSFHDFLADGPCYHLLRFSTFEPNPITGAFSGEIRTGYFFNKGQKMPIKGGSVSGSIQEAFKKAFFSREKTQRESYLGPEAVRIENLDIAGT